MCSGCCLRARVEWQWWSMGAYEASPHATAQPEMRGARAAAFELGQSGNGGA